MSDPVRPLDHAFVVPAYGDSPFLAECLESIAAQTLRGSIVVVTTSTPSAYLSSTARRYGLPLRINPRRASIGCDWNFALLATDAAYVTVAHQDDTYHPEYLATLLAATQAEATPVIAFCDYGETTAEGARPVHLNIRVKRLLCRRVFRGKRALLASADRRRLLAWGNPICCPSVILNRRAVPDFRFVESLESNLDWEAWLRLAECPGAFVYVPRALVTRRIHGASETSAAIEDQRRSREDRAMFDRFWPAPVSALIAAIYRASYRANRT